MSIEQHPIPQDVAGYKFRLIGEMTVKQFIWLASGIVLGLIAYSLPLPFFFKYPLTGLFVALGAGIAFLPIEGRPMDKWLIAFIKSVYSPTQYVWKKSANEAESQIPVVSSKPVTTPITQTPPQPKADPPLAEIPITTPVVPQTTPQPRADPPLAENLKSPISSPPAGNLPIPFTPTTPNTLVGMTLTPEGKILDGCLIEIRANGISLRATKSNQLGQFLFAKPLENGQYQILTEKSGFVFDSYSISLTGQVVKPLRLQAKTKTI